MLHYIENKSIILFLIISFTLWLGVLGFTYFKSKYDGHGFKGIDKIFLIKKLGDNNLYKISGRPIYLIFRNLKYVRSNHTKRDWNSLKERIW